jgi:hypothetical protein
MGVVDGVHGIFPSQITIERHQLSKQNLQKNYAAQAQVCETSE